MRGTKSNQNKVMRVPLGMLVTSAKYIEDDTAEMFGFWYYKEMHVPSTVEEKKKLFWDLLNGRCVPLRVKGTFQQILDLIMQSDKYSKAEEEEVRQFKILADGMETNAGKRIAFENLVRFEGTSLSLDADCEVNVTIESIRERIYHDRRTVELKISVNWKWGDEFLDALKGKFDLDI